MPVTSMASRRHRDVSAVSCVPLLPLRAGIRTALHLERLSQLLVGSTYCSLSRMGAVLSAVWFISEIVQSLLHESVPKRLRGALPGIHRFIFIHHFPAQQWPLCKTISILSPTADQFPAELCAHKHTCEELSWKLPCGCQLERGTEGRQGPGSVCRCALQGPNQYASSRDRNGDCEQLRGQQWWLFPHVPPHQLWPSLHLPLWLSA